jgi:ankyrin repeat protein
VSCIIEPSSDPNKCASVETIELVLDANSGVISEKDRDGLLPLHLCIRVAHGWSAQALELLFSRYPDVVPNVRSGFFPLHCCLRAIAVNGNQDYISSLIEAYPEAASIMMDRWMDERYFTWLATKAVRW